MQESVRANETGDGRQIFHCIEFKKAPAGSEKFVGECRTTSETTLIIRPNDASAEIQLDDGSHSYSFVKQALQWCERIDISIGYHFQASFHSLVWSRNAHRFTRLLDNENVIACTWTFDSTSREMQKLFQVLGHSHLIVNVALYLGSYTSQTKANGPMQQWWPSLAEPAQSLVALANLMTAANSELVLLAPSRPAGETRLLRAHKRSLCEASTYFASLLQSDFAEASALRQGSLQRASSSPPLEVYDVATATSQGQRIGVTNETPTLRLNDISYGQLQTLLFYVYTGEVVFEKPAMAHYLYWWGDCLEPADAFEMYRIAHKYVINGLRSAALRHIAKWISKSSVLEDLRTREEITLFPEIKEVYSNFCKAAYPHIPNDSDELIKDVLGLDMAQIRSLRGF